jgi:hypothetical protein
VTAAARDEPVHDETYLPREDDAEIIDFLSALRDRGGQPAGARPRLVGPDGRSVELPESMFGVLLQVAAAMKAGLAVTVDGQGSASGGSYWYPGPGWCGRVARRGSVRCKGRGWALGCWLAR